MSTRTVKRLRRILDVVPFLASHPGVDVEEVCERFGVRRQELLADLNLLWVCGLPPYGPGDLFDAVIEDDRIWLGGVDPLARPFGLERAAAARMLLGARLVAEVPGLDVSQELASGAAKVEAALGEGPVGFGGDAHAGPVLHALQAATRDRTLVRLTYWSLSRESEDVRDVEPLHLVRRGSVWYLIAWCRNAEGLRTFRVDRIRGAQVLAERFERDVEPGELGYRPAPQDLRVTLELAPEAAWVAQRYPTEAREDLDGGRVRVTMAAPSGAFFERLLVRLGAAAEIVAPVWLEAARRERARAVRSLYG